MGAYGSKETENGEQRTGNRKQGTGNGEQENDFTPSQKNTFTEKQNKQWKIKKIQLLNNQFKLQ